MSQGKENTVEIDDCQRRKPDSQLQTSDIPNKSCSYSVFFFVSRYDDEEETAVVWLL